MHQVEVPIRYRDGEAFCRPSTATVHVPRRKLFRAAGDATASGMFYSVAFDEVGHATGHERRLARDLKGRFGDAAYAAEELAAELCSVFVIDRCCKASSAAEFMLKGGQYGSDTDNEKVALAA